MDKLYKLHGKMTRMSDQGALDAVLGAERQSRGGGFSYSPNLVYQSQIDGIKAEWPDDLKQLVRAKAAEFAGGQPITAAAVRRAIEHVVMEVVVPRRAKVKTDAWLSASARARAQATETETKIAAADLAMSAIMGVAPCADDVMAPRKTKMGLAVARTSRAPGNLIVRTTEAKDADVFFLCHYVPALRRSWVVGWATRDEVSRSEHGNSDTDSSRFPWKYMSHCLGRTSLRPMSEALGILGLKDVPEGILFEAPPKEEDLPWQAAGDVESFLTTNEQSGKDFYAILGMEPPVAAEPPRPQAPAQRPLSPQKQDDF